MNLFNIQLPKHIFLEISHNTHKEEHKSLRDYLKDLVFDYRQFDRNTYVLVGFESVEHLDRSLYTEEIWEMIYFVSTNGFVRLSAPTLEELLDYAIRSENKK